MRPCILIPARHITCTAGVWTAKRTFLHHTDPVTFLLRCSRGEGQGEGKEGREEAGQGAYRVQRCRWDEAQLCFLFVLDLSGRLSGLRMVSLTYFLAKWALENGVVVVLV